MFDEKRYREVFFMVHASEDTGLKISEALRRKRKKDQLAFRLAAVCTLTILLSVGTVYAYHSIKTALFFHQEDTMPIESYVQALEEPSREDGIASEELLKVQEENTFYIQATAELLNDYRYIKELADDSCALVKVRITRSTGNYVRSYIYTSYEAEILTAIYGEAGSKGDHITVNMPGGCLEGDEAKAMIKEVTTGKADAESWSHYTKVISDGGTDRLLQTGDTAYLFLIPESGGSYAVTGEYRGAFLVDGTDILYDKNIIGFSAGKEFDNRKGTLSEEEFISAVNNM